MNKKRLYAEPKHVFATRRNKVLGVISIFLILIILSYYILWLFNIIPAEELGITILFTLFEIPVIFVLVYDYIFSKRLIIYEDGLYTSNRKKFISFDEINFIRIDSRFSNSIYLRVIHSDNQEEVFPVNVDDLNRVRNIFARNGIAEKKPTMIRRMGIRKRASVN
jgi:hypothetical protein